MPESGFSFPRALAGAALCLYGAAALYASAALEPRAKLLADEMRARLAEKGFKTSFSSVRAHHYIGGFSASVCGISAAPVSAETPVDITFPGCVVFRAPYYGNRITAETPSGSLDVLYGGKHTLITRTPLRGTLSFAKRTGVASRVQRLFLQIDEPRFAEISTRNARFYSDTPGNDVFYAAADHFSVRWETPEANSAIGETGYRTAVSIKNIVSDAGPGADSDKYLFPFSFLGEFNMEHTPDPDGNETLLSEEVTVDRADFYFKDFAVRLHGVLKPAGIHDLYPEAEAEAKIYGLARALDSALPALLLLPGETSAYEKGAAAAAELLQGLRRETDEEADAVTFSIRKPAGKPLTVGGKTLDALAREYRRILSR